jgi:hypothetical protein
LLCHAKDKRIAELEEDNKSIDLYKKIAIRNAATRDDAYREAILAMKRANRSVEGFKMVREEALTYRCMAKFAKTVVLEECELKNEALFKTRDSRSRL